MSAKGARLAGLVEGCQGTVYDPRYLGWFRCFDRGAYYDAHDVLESLWAERGRADPSARFWQALIQLAGAFVHLRLHREQPEHRVHGARLGPALRLLRLAQENLAGYPAAYQGVDVRELDRLCGRWCEALAAGSGENPWTEAGRPWLDFPAAAEGCPAARAAQAIM